MSKPSIKIKAAAAPAAAGKTKVAAAPAASGKAKVAAAAIHVTSRGPQRWRAGLCFTNQGRDVALADLTPEQLAAIKADPELVIVDRVSVFAEQVAATAVALVAALKPADSADADPEPDPKDSAPAE